MKEENQKSHIPFMPVLCRFIYLLASGLFFCIIRYMKINSEKRILYYAYAKELYS